MYVLKQKQNRGASGRSVEALHHGVLHCGVDVAGALALAESEDALDDAELCGGGVEARDGHPVVDDHAGADDVAAPVDGAGDEGYLQQAGQLVLVLDAGLGVHEAALVGQAHVAADQHVVGHGLAEDLDAQHVGNDLLRLALEIRMHQRDVIVGRNDVSEGRQALLDALDTHRVGQRVAQVLQLLVRGGRGHQQALAVAGGEAADDACAGNGGAHDGDDVLQLGLEDTGVVMLDFVVFWWFTQSASLPVKVLAGAKSHQGV